MLEMCVLAWVWACTAGADTVASLGQRLKVFAWSAIKLFIERYLIFLIVRDQAWGMELIAVRGGVCYYTWNLTFDI
jgi:hypothetical protein